MTFEATVYNFYEITPPRSRDMCWQKIQGSITCSTHRVFPGAQFDSEWSKKNQSEISSPHIHQEIEVDFSSTRVFPGVPFDSESSKKNPIKTSAATETNTSYNDEKDIHATKTNPKLLLTNVKKG